MLKKNAFPPIWLVFITVVLLSNCSKAVENEPAVSKALASPFNLSADTYLSLAANSQGAEKQDMLLMAAGREVYHGNVQAAEAILAQTTQLSAEQTDLKNILLAKRDLLKSLPQEAVHNLSLVKSSKKLPVFYESEYHEILARAYESLGNVSLAVAERIKLQNLLPESEDREKNQRTLWLQLNKMPEAELNTLALEAPENSGLQGWTSLALIAREPERKEGSLAEDLGLWQRRFPAHAANRLLSVPANRGIMPAGVHKIAVLLPLTGPLAGPGNAVRDGLTAAWHSSESSRKIELRFYDTAKEDASGAYLQALNFGADYVVGPLTKADAAKVAALDHPVPTLLLNELDTGFKPNLYQFGLSPANEAREVALEARKKGLGRALIIGPDSPWGKEVVTAFESRFQEEGGHVVEKMVFGNDSDLTRQVRDFLHVQEKEVPQTQNKGKRPAKVQTEISRREDFDMIFLLAYPSRARQIMPLLKYYFAGNVPVYATSSVYSGTENKMRDKDLDGIVFCDMPWVFNEHLSNKSWPEQFNSYNRLYALGVESFAVGRSLNKLLLFPAVGIHEKSGIVYMNSSQQIIRQLAWGHFKQGIAHKIEV